MAPMRFPLMSAACASALVFAGCAPTSQTTSSDAAQSASRARATAAPSASAAPVAQATAPAAQAVVASQSAPAVAQASATSAPLAAVSHAPALVAAAQGTSAPAGTASPAAPATATPAPPVVASAAPTVMLPPNAPPQIVAVNLDKTTVRGGDTVSGSVETSSNVASVEARIAGFSMSVPKVSEGKFALAYTVPRVPFFLRRTYTLEVIARNTAGEATSRAIPITIH